MQSVNVTVNGLWYGHGEAINWAQSLSVNDQWCISVTLKFEACSYHAWCKHFQVTTSLRWSPSHASWPCDRMSDSTAIFRQACLAEVTDGIRIQVLVKRLTATSSKITKISWWEMLLNYRWNWCWQSWQIARLTFTCEHVQFEWLRLLHPANEAGILSKFSSIN